MMQFFAPEIEMVEIDQHLGSLTILFHIGSHQEGLWRSDKQAKNLKKKSYLEIIPSDTINWKVGLTQKKKLPKHRYCFKHPYEKQNWPFKSF